MLSTLPPQNVNPEPIPLEKDEPQNMPPALVKKVIRASAGTGKTFRLSLEYIGLLLRFREQGLRFQEIVVITFTKKATAEIRERVFEHLQALVEQNEQGRELTEILDKVLDLRIGADELEYLRSTYHAMLMNKSQVQISTIDSFVHTIFTSIILPYLGITSFEINDVHGEALFEELYQVLLEEENLPRTLGLFQKSGRRSVAEYEQFIKSLVDNRWFFHLAASSSGSPGLPEASEEAARTLLTAVQALYREMMATFEVYLAARSKPISLREALKKEFYDLFLARSESSELAETVAKKLADPDFLRRNHKFLLKGESFWNGSRVLRGKDDQDIKNRLQELLQEASEKLADYLLLSEFWPEQEQILEIARLVYQKYDEIKFRTKIFTHNDILYYTFKYLYDPHLSIVEDGSVTNAFYEYLTGRIRFLLIDEFQDTSILQFKILWPIIKEIISGMGLKEYGGAIVVGDEKQAIYGWRGGERELLLRMPSILDGADEARLGACFRSHKKVLDFINALFGDASLHEHLAERGIHWDYEEVRGHKAGDHGYIRVEFGRYSRSSAADSPHLSRDQVLRDFVEQTLLPLYHRHLIDISDTAILARRNDDLDRMANILDEYGVSYLKNSSASILSHRVVRPLLYLMRFFVYGDTLELLRFLRSDYVLLSPQEMKRLLMARKRQRENDGTRCRFLQELVDVPAIEKIVRLDPHGQEPGPSGPWLLEFIKRVVEEFNVINLFPLESDIKNLNLLLKIVAEFENQKTDYAHDLKGLLEYLQENESREEWQQLSFENAQAINLMTIHKAKGLEFDNVFLFWDVGALPPGGRPSLKLFIRYSDDFHSLRDFAFTLNFAHVLPRSRRRELSENEDIRNGIEELNNFYVAMTRAKSRLFLYFAFQGTKGLREWADHFDPGKASIPSLVAHRILHLDGLEFRAVDEHKWQADLGELESTHPTEPTEEEEDFSFIRNYLDINRRQFISRDEERWQRARFLDFKTVFLKNKDVARGNAIHYYLSLIEYATPEAMGTARRRTRAAFGDVLSEEEIRSCLERADDLIRRHPDYFSPQHWPRVFTEYTLFHPSGRQVRLDRLMVDPREKRVLILDYKTGEFYEQEQMDLYIETIRALPFVKRNGFTVRGEFLEID